MSPKIPGYLRLAFALALLGLVVLQFSHLEGQVESGIDIEHNPDTPVADRVYSPSLANRKRVPCGDNILENTEFHSYGFTSFAKIPEPSRDQLDAAAGRLLDGMDREEIDEFHRAAQQAEQDRWKNENEFARANASNCDPLKLAANVQVSQSQFLEVPLNLLNHMARKSIYRDHISFPDDELEGDHVSHHWFYFSGDSVWLQDYGVHFHVTRVFFSRDGIRSHPKFSVLYAQLYDADWREVKGMLQLQTSAPVKPKETFFSGLFRSFLPSQLYRRENEFSDGPSTSSTNMKFPQILPIPFRQNSESFLGPEDPRITLRKNPLGFEEPMIVFNMKSYELGNKRCLHTYFPFTETLTPLSIQGYPPLGNQKNWVPFFDPTEAVNTHAQFLYNLNPLEVLNCDLATGACRFIQGSAAGNSVLKLNDLKLSKMRGGSTLWPIPDALQTKLSTGKRLWVGFARAHLVNCGCGDSMYRPNLFVLQQNTFTGEYEVLANSEFLDFDVEITPWKNPPGEDPVCEGVNVLIPNGISYWYVRETKKPKKSPFGLFGGKSNEEQDGLKGKIHLAPNSTEDASSSSAESGGIASLGEPKATSTAKDSLKSRSSGSVAETFSEGPNPGSFDDYMGLTISSGDANVQIVHIRGLLNHIASLPGLFDDVDSGSFQDIESLASGKTPSFTERRWSNAVGCALQYSSFYCMKLGAANDKVLEMKKTKEYQEKAKAEAEAKAKVDAERIKEETRIKEIEEEERKVKQALEMDEKKKEEHRKAMHQGENK